MRLLIASSSTGGHIYPALAIAEEVKRREPDAELLFVTASWEIGRDIVRSSGHRQVFLDVSGFDRRNPFNNIKALRDFVRASREARALLQDFEPDVVLGTGGHIAGPVIREAKRAGIRAMIQEQNVIPGMANRLAERYADKVFVGFSETAGNFKNQGKVIVSGNPVRAAFAEAAAAREETRSKYGVAEGAFCVLFFGGSQGAAAINEMAKYTVGKLSGGSGEETGAAYHFIVITGRENEQKGQFSRLLEEAGNTLLVMEYSDAIWELYAAADVIISRAGALTVSEIGQSGRASILIPSPNVTNNHQYYNAKILADAGAAILMEEEKINSEKLAAEIERLASDPDKVLKMGSAALGSARPDAAKVIVDEILGK